MKRFSILVSALFSISALYSCGNQSSNSNTATPHQFDDPHTLSNYKQVQVSHLDLNLQVDFEQKMLQGIATWTLAPNRTSDTLVLDTDELQIDSVIYDSGKMADFYLAAPLPIHGSALYIPLDSNTEKVHIYYRVTHRDDDTFAALQWLEPEQTFNKKMPFFFTKSEPTMSRCWIPCQDLPSIRITYTAQVTVPKGMMAVMSATNPQNLSEDGHYSFEMKQPIPVYLVALAAGDLRFKAIDERTGVYAEPSMIQRAAEEFSEIPQMMQAAESLVGPYRWARYDVLVLPKGFPIGGMENPLLTFATPTIIAGDKSLVSLIAHELAHSWAGNQVTNATWNDLWINEGLTVYLERRIMEAIRGKDYADMLWAIGRQDLDYTLDRLGEQSELTKLKLNLKDISAQESFTDIAYEKGAHFIWALENTVGRQHLDSFLRYYYDKYAFQCVSTEMFIHEIEEKLLSLNSNWSDQLSYIEWIFNPGLPKNCPTPGNALFGKVDEQRKQFEQTKDINTLNTEQWSTHEWLHFIRHFSPAINAEVMSLLDKKFKLSYTHNSEIACAWYLKAIQNNYQPAFRPMENFLSQTGRGKFVEPLYEALAIHQPEMCDRIFESSKNNYHPNVRKTLISLIHEAKTSK